VGSITVHLADAAALRALHEQELSKGRAFVAGESGVREREACDLVLDHAGRTFVLRAEAVFVKADGPRPGVGLQLAALDAEGKAALQAFVDATETMCEAQVEAPAEGEELAEEEADDEGVASERDARASRTLADKIRGLSSVEQHRLAATGTLQERIALERTFGANVWEVLLSNARLTIPEVARIARKGTLSRQLVEDIAGHASWVAAPEVQRSLLANPRSTTAVVTKVLRALTRSDLQLVPQQAAYPQTVRAAAKKMLAK
jgi:hypothetical protein